MSPDNLLRRPGRPALAVAALLACALSSLQAAPPQHQARSGPRQHSPVVEALMAGQDARTAIAQARVDPVPTAHVSTAPGRTAFAGYAHALDAVREQLAALPRSGAVVSGRLRSTIEQAQAQQWLVEARIEQVGGVLDMRALPAVARTRWATHRAEVLTTIQSIGAGLAALEQRLPQSGAPELGAAELDQWKERLSVASSGVRVFGANALPVHRPRLPPRAPQMAPAIVPTYLDRANDPGPAADDRVGTADAPLSTALIEQAGQLGHEPARIFDFVRSTVRTQWYAGAQKGAERTLLNLAGNDVDQASLLIALLRASNIAARYVRGVVVVPVDDLARMLGVRSDKVGQALTAAGVPNEPVVLAGTIGAFRVEQIFVSAYVPLSAYRGTSAESSGYAWVPLMPALKPHAFAPAAGVLGAASVDVRTVVTNYLTVPVDVLPRSVLERQVDAYLATLSPRPPLESQLSRHAVQAPPLELLPLGMPFPVIVVTGEYAALPAEAQQVARLRVRAGADEASPALIEREFPLSGLLDRRLTLSYEPASIDDGAIADAFGGLGSTPPYLLHLRPVLSLAGQPVAHGLGEVEGGQSLRLEIEFGGPAGHAVFAQNVLAGGYDAISIEVQGESPATQASTDVLVGDSEPPAARILANFGARYLGEWDDEDDALARLIGVTVLRPLPSAVLVTNQYRVDRVGSTVDALVWQGVALDAGLRPAEPLAQNAVVSSEADWTLVSALQGSVLEHRLFEQQWSVESISADKG
ncbi:MAG TPA: transglutaminase domain-containing protein, partial [Rhodanobacteraceae bacterium]|nr:transglutaminase domain-containing protein [Rhodanobacteraceae bacterium]